jgi:hypothetical protein
VGVLWEVLELMNLLRGQREHTVVCLYMTVGAVDGVHSGDTL